MKIKLLISSLLTTLIAVITFAQKVKIESGNFDFLKDQKEINVIITYDNLKFYNDNLSENEYLVRRKKEIEEKNSGEYSNWLKHWNECKKTNFIDKFLSSANKQKSNLNYAKNSNAKYSIILETKWIYPGWFGGAMKQHAKISTVAKFVETKNKSKVLLSISFDKAPGDMGMVGTPNTNTRISEGYAKTGKELAKLINKKIK